jgi:exopolyphosphatase/guanosine-5'-triphosphate,3'-diphosphate pyrophosphatase
MTNLAAIDIGTNSVRLVVVQTHPDGTWTTLDSSREPVRLGDSEFSGGSHRIDSAALDRCARVIARFADIAKGFGVNEIVALATAAAREADNQDELIERVYAASSGAVNVRVIGGDEEARLIYLGVLTGVELLAGENALFMDIGGGSTELIIGDKLQHYTFIDSLKIGAIRLTAEMIPARAEPVSIGTWSTLRRYVRSIVEPAARGIRAVGFQRMIGSSGTVMALADIAARRKAGEAGGNAPVTLRGYELSLSDVQQIAQNLCKLTLEQRRKVPGLQPERADIIVAGAAIVQTVMETVGAESIFISERGLREGIVADLIQREHLRLDVEDSVRVRSTNRLARRTQVDLPHAEHIIKLSDQLFDETRKLDLHNFSDAERELLHYGALLHDCGFFVSHTLHQQHSYYLIRHSELLGFNDVEIEVIAQIALYHRKGLPKEKRESFASLPEHERQMVRVLSCLVRLAEAMDRSHLALVQSVKLSRDPRAKDVIRISPNFLPDSDPALELWAIQAQSDAFAKTFGITVDVSQLDELGELGR